MTDRLHALPQEEALRRLETGMVGLASDEAARRLREIGPNRLPDTPAPSAFRRFLAQFDNLIVYLLIGSTVVTALLGHWVDAGVIAAVVLVNAVIGFIQEGRAEQAMAAIRGMLAPHAAVLRDGRRATVEAADLVAGRHGADRSGRQRPRGSAADPSAGACALEEAVPHRRIRARRARASNPVAAEAALGDRSRCCSAARSSPRARGAVVVAATGARTETRPHQRHAVDGRDTRPRRWCARWTPSPAG